VIWREGALRQRKTKWFATRAEAEALVAAVAEALAEAPREPLTERAKAGEETVAKYAERWLEAMRPNWKRTTHKYHRINLAKILPIIGHRATTSLTREVCKGVLTTLRGKGYARGTVEAVRRTLSSLVAELVDDKVLAVNVAADLRKYAGRGDERIAPPWPLTAEELTQYLHNAKYLEPAWYPLLVVAASTGMRAGELYEARLTEPKTGRLLLNLDTRKLEIIGSRSGGEASSPKNHKARMVDTGAFASAVVSGMLEARLEAGSRAAKASEYLFLTPKGSRVQEDGNLRRILARIAAGEVKRKARRGKGKDTPAPPAPLGVRPLGRKVTLQHLRDTYATLQLIAGTPDLYVSAQLGHADSVVTRQRYAKWIRGQEHDYADRLGAMMAAEAPAELPGKRNPLIVQGGRGARPASPARATLTVAKGKKTKGETERPRVATDGRK
jgi:integrase